MARYGDLDALAVKWMLASPEQKKIFRQIIDKHPTADVVPKSEVEALKHQLEMIIDEGEYWEGKFLVARSTVAREIFEDIDKYYTEKIYLLMDIPTYLAELKKKYTEEKQ